MKKSLLILSVLILLSAPIFARAADLCPPNSTTLCDPTGQGTLDKFGIQAAKDFGFVLGWTVIVMVMFSGFRMIMAQGNEEDLAKARSAFQWSLSGLILAIFAYLIVYATVSFIGIGNKDISASQNVGDLNPTIYSTFGDLLSKGLIQGFLKLAGALSILMIIIAGFRYLTARGNDEQVEQARSSLTWSVLGLAVILLAYVITVAVAGLFGPVKTTLP